MKLHKCSLYNLWINIDIHNKHVIAGNSISDVQCTNEDDNNFNTVVYYYKKEELLKSISKATEGHRTKTLESHFNRPKYTISLRSQEDKKEPLEKHFKKPFKEIAKELFEDLTLIEDKKYEESIFKTEHHFHNGNYGTSHIRLEEV